MRVAYFSNQFATKTGHGVARYAREVYESVTRNSSDIELTPVATWSDRDEDDLQKLVQSTGMRILPWGRRWTPLTWTLFNGPLIERWLDFSADLVHVVALGFRVSTRKPLVVTVHDIGPLTRPEYFSETQIWVLKRSVHQAIHQAAAIICVSQATANELQNYAAKDLSNRIHVVHEGVDEQLFEAPATGCLQSLADLPPDGVPIVLTAGKISPRKNVSRVIQAFSRLRDEIPHHLVLVGGSGWDAEEVLRQVNDPMMSDRVHSLGFVTDQQLQALYHRASVYVHPSLFEGFGLTVLEAMAAGCPVVTSNVYSLPEVAGDAAVLVEPTSVDAISEGIRRICTDASLAQDLSRRGIERALTFTWRRCGDRIGEIYRSVL